MTWLERVIATHAASDRLAAIDESGAVTGRELVGKIASAAEFLTALNTADGQSVPALLTTNADALALLLAGAATDKPLAPLGPRLTATELDAVVRATGSPVLVTEAAFTGIADDVAATAGVRTVTLPALPVSSAPVPSQCRGAAFYLYTSGTTGLPKPVPFTDDVLAARTEVLGGLVGFTPDDRYATGSPLHHIGGLGNTLVALASGAAILATNRFSTDWWCGLRQLGATHCLLVPSMIEMLLTENLLHTVPLKTLIYGAAPITPDTLHRVLQLLPNLALVNLFGQTEGSPITCLGPDDHRRAAAGASAVLSTVGRPVPGLQLRIDQPDAAGVGEVVAAAPHLSVHGPDGWLHTGDLGAVDSDGYLRLRGRRHDMVVRGGENIYPLEVENVLAAHPDVAAVGVVGVPDSRLGETLAAFIVPADPARPPAFEELRTFTRARLAGFKVPAYWYVVDALPLNGAGKVLRTALRSRHLIPSAEEAAGPESRTALSTQRR
ncbi:MULTISPECIES: class I adenylate-forming enzyme family protein [Mycolicibacter]|uniref:Long-chain fatty acid--CoA ligase n=1 Tax=Mycolicibacter kumamotonensis TaxID=354243 RepID=A0A7K3L6J1_9MYCO|nr:MULTISPECIES: fatty acid--CoA ligase family protein [Mycolicibacter]NDJ88018.1 long-chain fatty acid--CoA ligase [Mycolicibacter kumamotonensis]RAV02831.1 long-chain fatty acid--CoA ligase [Mycolicibacter senuensis]